MKLKFILSAIATVLIALAIIPSLMALAVSFVVGFGSGYIYNRYRK